MKINNKYSLLRRAYLSKRGMSTPVISIIMPVKREIIFFRVIKSEDRAAPTPSQKTERPVIKDIARRA